MSGHEPSNKVQDTDGTTVFREARDNFMRQLSNEEKSMFTRVNTPAELLADLAKLQQSKNDSRWMKVLSSVKFCSDQLQSYFEVVAIICQSLEWASVVWGALRLAFKVLNIQAC